jgi:hypothetical protein
MSNPNDPTFTLRQQLYHAHLVVGSGNPDTQVDREKPQGVVILATRDGSESVCNGCQMTMLAAALIMVALRDKDEGTDMIDVMKCVVEHVSNALADLAADAIRATRPPH